ncbi:MAG: tetratricopeptide repeat protein [Ruminococcaceae bacterium]|nr:tetratricopeptide repeat protein [Oscillospiraceae bacterium]
MSGSDGNKMNGGLSEGARLFDRASQMFETDGASEQCALLFEQAGQAFEKENAPVRQSAMAYNRAGMCRFKCSDDTSAEAADFERARDLMKSLPDRNGDPLMAIIRSNLAECKARSGEREEAAKLYRQSAVTLSDLMYDELSKGSAGEAFDQYVGVQKSLAQLYRDMGEYIQAQTCFTRVISLIENHSQRSDQTDSMLAGFYNARGTVRYRVKDYAGEVEDCTRAILLSERVGDDLPGLGIMYSNRGEAYEMLGMYDAMIVDMRQAASIFEKCGEMEGAKEMLFRSTFSIAKGLELSERLFEAAKTYGAAAELMQELRDETDEGEDTSSMLKAEAACRISRAACLCRCELHLYYDSLREYNRAAALLEGLEDRGALSKLESLYLLRSELYEAFDELEEAKADYLRSKAISERLMQTDEQQPQQPQEQV